MDERIFEINIEEANKHDPLACSQEIIDEKKEIDELKQSVSGKKVEFKDITKES